MSDLFQRRMENLFKSGEIENTLGRITQNETVAINEATFTNDPNYKRGMLYDWDMNEIETVDFKFQKNKTHTIANDEVEYNIQFRSGFNPENRYIDIYYKLDGKPRLGFYIDIEDENTGVMEKWLIVGKDDKNYFDRYIVLKCNWVFEWIDKETRKYHACLGVLRDRNNYNSGVWNNGMFSTVENQSMFFMPTNQNVVELNYDYRFMFGDSLKYPKIYEISKIMDTFPLGITKFTLVQDMYNEHTDYYGLIDDLKNYELTTEDEIPDLPSKFGGKYHMLCDIIKSKMPARDNVEPSSSPVTWHIGGAGEKIYVGRAPHILTAIPNQNTTEKCSWKIYVDNVEYSIGDLEGYFEIAEDVNKLSIKAINKVMIGYIVKVVLYNKAGVKVDSARMEVSV